MDTEHLSLYIQYIVLYGIKKVFMQPHQNALEDYPTHGS